MIHITQIIIFPAKNLHKMKIFATILNIYINNYYKGYYKSIFPYL